MSILPCLWLLHHEKSDTEGVNLYHKENSMAFGLKSALNRKLLNTALSVIKRHVEKQDGISLLRYDRHSDELSPLAWRARSITRNDIGGASQATNTWPGLQVLSDYRGKIVVDVGANCGAVAKMFAMEADEVYAFEPHPRNFANLLDQIKIRDLRNIQAFQIALSNFNGETELIEREAHGIHSLGPHNRGKIVSKIPIQVRTLDDFWKDKGDAIIGLLKIDVEGFESEVLQGAKNLLREKAIDAIVFEFSPKIHKMRGVDIGAPISFLKSMDYKVFDIDGEPFNISPAEYPSICDLIAVPNRG